MGWLLSRQSDQEEAKLKTVSKAGGLFLRAAGRLRGRAEPLGHGTRETAFRECVNRGARTGRIDPHEPLPAIILRPAGRPVDASERLAGAIREGPVVRRRMAVRAEQGGSFPDAGRGFRLFRLRALLARSSLGSIAVEVDNRSRAGVPLNLDNGPSLTCRHGDQGKLFGG